MTLTTKTVVPLLLLCVLAGIVLGGYLLKPDISLGSVAVSNDYYATSTAASTGHGATITGTQLIKTGPGSFGSVVVTGATVGAVNIYDATTTNILLRTGNKATSTILIASLPASLVAGTYTFDAQFGTGLLVELYNGTMPTTTITYR